MTAAGKGVTIVTLDVSLAPRDTIVLLHALDRRCIACHWLMRVYVLILCCCYVWQCFDRFSGCKAGEACTIVLRGASDHVLDEAER